MDKMMVLSGMQVPKEDEKTEGDAEESGTENTEVEGGMAEDSD
jgi:hypothetical protein